MIEITVTSDFGSIDCFADEFAEKVKHWFPHPSPSVVNDLNDLADLVMCPVMPEEINKLSKRLGLAVYIRGIL